MSYDVIILGLGAMGSAAAYHLARRGKRVLGIEQFTSPHDKGSSHGGSRIIRQAYWESPEYIPLVLRAYELWTELQKAAHIPLLEITGGLIVGRPDCDLVSRSIEAGSLHSIPFEVLGRQEVESRYPVFRISEEEVGVFEPRAGFLVPEQCVRAHLEGALRQGGELHFEEEVIEWTTREDGVEVRTHRGRYEAAHLILSAGPWAGEVMGKTFPLQVTRQVMAWIQPRTGVAPFVPGKFPVFILDDANGRPAYGFPAIDGPAGGVKAAVHGSEEVCSPESIDRVVHPADIDALIRKLKPRIPALEAQVVRAKTCLYTMTPDEHFIIGTHPETAKCTVACGFSGHGFKFASVIGEVLADLATTGTTRHAIDLFSPLRFSGAAN